MSRFRAEIDQQPEVLARLLESGPAAAHAIAARIAREGAGQFVIAARGSSDNAALFAAYARPPRLSGSCVIGISQSGESSDVVAGVEEARRQGCVTVAITNNAGSRLASAVELALLLGSGDEVSVPASKTYTASLLALALVSEAIDSDHEFEAALHAVPQAVAGALARDASIETMVPAFVGPRAVVLARAWSVADFEHAPVAVGEPGLPVVVVDGGGSVATEFVALMARLEANGCRVVHLFDLSGLPEELSPIPMAVLGQLLAHHVALSRGIDADRPRAIQKVRRTS